MHIEEDKLGLFPRRGLGGSFTWLTKHDLYPSDYFSCVGDIWSLNSTVKKLVPSAPCYAFLLRALGQFTHKGLNITWTFLYKAFSDKLSEPQLCFFISILMNVLQGCQWASVGAVNFRGTWRKCLCVHRGGHSFCWVSAYTALSISNAWTCCCVPQTSCKATVIMFHVLLNT